jgi:hypothetical protein
MQFDVAGKAQQYPHAVDAAGALWYVDGDDVIRQSSPARRDITRFPRARSGAIFSYQGGVYVLGSNGASLTRVDRKGATVTVPSRFAPLEGAIADSLHRWVIFARSSPNELAAIDVWRWYAESVPHGVTPFAAALAGGPHGKKYLVVGDQQLPEIAVKDRSNGRALLVQLPENLCFSKDGSPWMVPVDVRGRDGDRTWVSSGEHVASIDLTTKRILRVWDLDGCAMHILVADGNRVIALVATRNGDDFVSSLVQVDRAGIHTLPQYGRIDGIAAGTLVDRYDRLWWFDSKSHAFVCRTPLE